MSQRMVNKIEFDQACDALWTEIEYQNSLPIRTADEATSVPAFLTLLRRYTRKTEDLWSDKAGVRQVDGRTQVPEALHGMRKLAAICIRAMVYNGIRSRSDV